MHRVIGFQLRAMAIFGLGVIFGLSGCATTRQAAEQAPHAVSVMAYNLENLFDTLPDQNREDFTFIAKKYKGSAQHRLECSKIEAASRRQECLEEDWSEASLERKLNRLADVILSVNGGKGPDILIMEEVENLNVLKMLNSKLAAARYLEPILIEGPDVRGIDLGMLSRLPVAEAPKLNIIPWKAKNEEDKTWMARSRGILQTTFKLPDGTLLTALGVHFPSPANPTYWREQAVDFINQLKQSLPADRLVVAGGDFNISSEEDTQTGLYRERLGKEWLVSHYIGCGDCVGTENFKGRWSFLDALLFSPQLGPIGKAKWRVNVDSIRVVKDSRYQTSAYLTPARFNDMKPVGVSDHYPVTATIELR